MSKVLLITYYWPPSGGAGVQRTLKFAKYLPEFGVEPIVLTIDESVASYPFLDASLLKDVRPELRVVKTKSRELLSTFKRFFPKVEVPHSGFANHNKTTFRSKVMRFVRGNLLIPDARVSWVKPAFREAVRLIEQEQIDTVYISSPPHSSQLVGLKLKKRFPNLRWIADLRDPWTDIFFYEDMLHTPLAKKIDASYERNVLEQADEILVVSKSIKASFAQKATSVESKIHVIPNGFDADDFNISSLPPTNEFLITHTGTMADSYQPDVLFSALKKAVQNYPDVNIRLLFVGKVTESIAVLAQKFGLEKQVSFVDYVPHSEITRYQKNTSCLLLVVPKTEGDKGILTGKLFEYLAARKPILGLGPSDGDANEIVKKCEAGFIFDRENETALENYLNNLIESWLINPNLDLPEGKSEEFSRRNLTQTLAHILRP